MMRNRCLFLSMVLLCVCLFAPQNSIAQSTISCNSDDERRHSCAVDTRGGVHLAKQHSGSACTEGYSWGSDNEGIWVDHGCRADFTIDESRDRNKDYRDQNRNENRDDRSGENVQSHVQTISCNSDDERRHSCSVDTRGGVRVATQHSDSACTEGYSWGSDNQGVWVDHGCRADFTVGESRDWSRDYGDDSRYGNRNYNPTDNRNDQFGGSRQSQRFACNSDDMRKHSCAVDTRGGAVRLAVQHSEAACTKGYSWGTNRRGIWVDHGCRADFVIAAKYGRDSWR
jgi:hypothetical protein